MRSGRLRTRISIFDVEVEKLVTSTEETRSTGALSDAKVAGKILERACLNREVFLVVERVLEVKKEGGVGEEAVAKAESEVGEGVMKLDDMISSSSFSRGGDAGEQRGGEKERSESGRRW